jgi:hypothetical protein
MIKIVEKIKHCLRGTKQKEILQQQREIPVVKENKREDYLENDIEIFLQNITDYNWEKVQKKKDKIIEFIDAKNWDEEDKLLFLIDRLLNKLFEFSDEDKDKKEDIDRFLIEIYDALDEWDWRYVGLFALKELQRFPEYILYRIAHYDDEDIKKFIEEKEDNLNFYPIYKLNIETLLFRARCIVKEEKKNEVTLEDVAEAFKGLYLKKESEQELLQLFNLLSTPTESNTTIDYNRCNEWQEIELDPSVKKFVNLLKGYKDKQIFTYEKPKETQEESERQTKELSDTLCKKIEEQNEYDLESDFSKYFVIPCKEKAESI